AVAGPCETSAHDQGGERKDAGGSAAQALLLHNVSYTPRDWCRPTASPWGASFVGRYMRDASEGGQSLFFARNHFVRRRQIPTLADACRRRTVRRRTLPRDAPRALHSFTPGARDNPRERSISDRGGTRQPQRNDRFQPHPNKSTAANHTRTATR